MLTAIKNSVESTELKRFVLLTFGQKIASQIIRTFTLQAKVKNYEVTACSNLNLSNVVKMKQVTSLKNTEIPPAR